MLIKVSEWRKMSKGQQLVAIVDMALKQKRERESV